MSENSNELPESVEALTLLLREMLGEMRKLSHPAFEVRLLEELKAGADMIECHRELHEVTLGLKTQVGLLVSILRARGLENL